MERGGAIAVEVTRSQRGKGGAIYHPWELGMILDFSLASRRRPTRDT
jgi:hypothetical protein